MDWPRTITNALVFGFMFWMLDRRIKPIEAELKRIGDELKQMKDRTW